jgi:hypothetical protein
LSAPLSIIVGEQHGVQIQAGRLVLEAVANSGIQAGLADGGGDDGEPTAESGQRIVDHQLALHERGVVVEAARLLEKRGILDGERADELDARLGEVASLGLTDVGPRGLVFNEHPLEERHRAEREQDDHDQREQ